MTSEFVVHLGKEAISLMLMISAPMLIAGLIVGLGISIMQAVTQIHEVTLTFIPKILAVSLTLMASLPWMLQKMLYFMHTLMAEYRRSPTDFVMNTTWMDVSVAQFQIFMLVFVRVIGIVAVSPFFGTEPSSARPKPVYHC